MTTQAKVLEQVAIERLRQDRKFGEQNPPNGTGKIGTRYRAGAARNRCDRAFSDDYGTWLHILDEEVCEAFAESDPAALRAELVQVAAVAVAWVEAIDRKAAT